MIRSRDQGLSGCFPAHICGAKAANWRTCCRGAALSWRWPDPHTIGIDVGHPLGQMGCAGLRRAEGLAPVADNQTTYGHLPHDRQNFGSPQEFGKQPPSQGLLRGGDASIAVHGLPSPMTCREENAGSFARLGARRSPHVGQQTRRADDGKFRALALVGEPTIPWLAPAQACLPAATECWQVPGLSEGNAAPHLASPKAATIPQWQMPVAERWWARAGDLPFAS